MKNCVVRFTDSLSGLLNKWLIPCASIRLVMNDMVSIAPSMHNMVDGESKQNQIDDNVTVNVFEMMILFE